MQQQQYPLYYKRFGVRRSSQLVSPILHSVETMDLPIGAVLHYTGDDDVVYGIAGDDFLLRHTTRMILVDYIVELQSKVGNPRSTYIQIAKTIRDYQRKYRRFRQVKDISTVWRDPRNLLIMNYAPLNHLWRYVKSMYSNYYRWFNVQDTMWKTIKTLVHESDRQHFIRCRLPTILPSPSMLTRAETRLNRGILQAFNEGNSLFILEIWKWLGNNREQSMLAPLKREELDKVNLVWQESGRWFTINLGLLDSWRRSPSEAKADSEDEDEDGSVTSATGGTLTPSSLQRRFLRLLMFLFEQRTVLGGDKGQTVGDITPDEEHENGPTVRSASGTETLKTINPSLKPLLGSDLPDIDDPEFDKVIDEAVKADLDALDHLVMPNFDIDLSDDEEIPSTPIAAYEPRNLSLEEGVMSKAVVLADAGLLSGAEYRRLEMVSTAYKKLPDPYGKHESLHQQSLIDPKVLVIPQVPQIPDIDTVFDKSMLKSSLFHFDSTYIEHVLPKDVTNAVLSVQNAGVAVTGYSIQRVEDAVNCYDAHTVRLTPVSGNPSTIRFRLPVIQPDGTFLGKGVRYRMRKQRGDLPIRKLSPSKVALTSYYSKLFIERSPRAVNNYPRWLVEQIRSQALDLENGTIRELRSADVFDSDLRLPRVYSTLAMSFRSFEAKGYDWLFDYHTREQHFGADLVTKAERQGMLVIAVEAKVNPILIDKDNTLYKLTGENLDVLGSIENVLGFDASRVPMEQIDIKIFSKIVPVGVFLAYQLGLEGLLGMLKVTPRRVPQGERLNLNDDEYALVFSDESLIFRREDKVVSMLLTGFRQFTNVIRNYSVHGFNRKDVYFNLMESAGLGVRILREMDLIMDMFVDPITKEILVEMKEPTDFIGLLVRSAELLQTDWSPDETDMSQMRIKGYERMAGAVYGELVKEIRTHHARRGNAGNSVNLAPDAVWQAVTQNDPAVSIVEESNPVHNMKEKEEVTYGGTGGRSRRSMVKRTRVFHQSDLGVISEATKDSSDVAVTTFLTADPGLTNLRGMTQAWKPGMKTTPANLLSTSALLAPAADRDDAKRVNFISIQQSSGMSAVGYRAQPIRTGYEQIVAHRVDDLFAYTAKDFGEITAVSPKAVTVTYSNGSSRSVEIGRRFGIAAGVTMPHELVTTLKVGDKVKPGEIIAHNTLYFELDALNPKQAIWKAGTLLKTAIMECADTLEDSSVLSERAAALIGTTVTKLREIVVKFDQSIRGIVAVGDKLDIESILCTIEDPVTANTGLFDASSLDTLRLLAAFTPRSKYHGVVEKIEVFYNGETDDMSESLRELASASDRNRRALAKALNKTYTSGSVDRNMHVDSHPLDMDTAVVKVYITSVESAGVGDKGVFANQMKTIFGRVMSGVNTTESGTVIDAIFGYESISARIVLSPLLIGTTNTLLKLISKRVSDTYFGS
jgi:hypothetical protein